METTEVIRARRSIRKFKSGAEVTQAQLDLLLEAAMMAPSACNTRPWEFLVVRDRDILEKIMEIHPYTKMLKTASLAIVICGLPDIQQGICVNYFPQDCGAATQNILLQAVALGLGACWCGVYPNEAVLPAIKALFNLDSIPFNIIAVGVPEETPDARGHYDKAKVRYIG